MANTFNLGNGNWAQKTEKLLAYNAENDNYKPLPFDFDRGSTATRVNKQGLIETVGVDEPRIDFLNNTKGHLLLEPSRTNKVTYSDDFTQWTDYNASAVLSEETIYGKNAYKIVEDNTTNYHGVYLSNLFTADGTNYIWSVYVKGAERRYVVLTGRTGISSNASALIFDTQDGVWVLDSSTQNQALSAESVGNGWWRISMEGNPTSGAYDNYTIASAVGFSSYLDANYQGDGTSGIYVAMPQLEEGSYATSYIPTSGSAVTRSAEQGIDGGAGSPIFSNTTAVWFLDIERVGVDADSSGSAIALRNSSFSQQIRLHFDSPSEQIRLRDGLSGFATISTITGMGANVRKKIALRINGSALSTFSQGSKIGSDYTAPSTFDIAEIDFATLGFKIHDMRFYNEALTDAELIALTS